MPDYEYIKHRKTHRRKHNTMRVPISWLKDYVDIDIKPEELAEKLTTAGFEVGKIDYIGVPQNQVEGIRVPPSVIIWYGILKKSCSARLKRSKSILTHTASCWLWSITVAMNWNNVSQVHPIFSNIKIKGELNPPLWTALRTGRRCCMGWS